MREGGKEGEREGGREGGREGVRDSHIEKQPQHNTQVLYTIKKLALLQAGMLTWQMPGHLYTINYTLLK